LASSKERLTALLETTFAATAFAVTLERSVMGRVYVALDIETTGLDPKRDAIIEIGAVRFRDNAVLDTWSTLVNPQRPVPYKIQLLTGIHADELQAAPHLPAAVTALNRFTQDHPVVGHNIPFDLSFLQPHGAVPNNPAVDTFQLANILIHEASRFSLAMLAQVLGIHQEVHHRALADAQATKDLLLALIERGLQMDLAVLQEINRMARNSQWPLKAFFGDLERERARTAFSSTVREQLLDKGHLDSTALGLVLDRKDTTQPLRPSEQKVSLDEEYLTSLLAADGLLAQRFPAYEFRPQQMQMLQAAIQTFNDGGQLLAEAGTGTGKSLAYLLPTIHFAVQNGRPVVISTNTINLQDQLFNKDIPDLQQILPLEFKAALLKGRSNYLCLRRLGIFRRQPSLSAEQVQVLAKILAWLPVTRTGDSAQLSLRDHELDVWRQVQAEQETCLGEKCPHRRKGRCFLYRARRNAEAAHVIVVNHALLLSDMLVANRVLPEYHHLIVDEAHHLEARATDQLGFAVNRGQTLALLSGLWQRGDGDRSRGFLPSIPQHLRGSGVSAEVQAQIGSYLPKLQQQVEEAQGAAEHLFTILQDCVGDLVGTAAQNANAYDQQVELTHGMRIQPGWSEVEILADDLNQVLLAVEEGLQGLHSGFTDLEGQNIVDYDDLLQDMWARLEHLRQLRLHLTDLVNEPQSEQIYWFRIGARDREITLQAAPLHVGPLLAQNLFPQMETLILTSATLSTAKEFDYIRDRLSLPDANELRVDSPFDYAQSTLLYLPTDIPEPAEPNYQNVLAKSMVELCLATEGRALLLFTSHRQLRTTYYSIARPLEEASIAVFGQGLDGSRQQLLERFRSTPRCVLLGTRSFWEGIDVVGPALSCLVITRLPFSVPTDPVFAARSRTFDDPFGQYAVPEAVLLFRQGFGRLIRSGTDRGVVAVLDKRVLSKNYGSTFLESLPECTVHRGLLSELPSEAARWIEGHTAGRQDAPK
jgi:DNA polymerase-3 subunit epsilon/ATP-dependent DNA helicase DinG